MYQFHLSFLGAFSIRLADRSLQDLGTDKVRALLVYLVLEPTRVHARGQLAALLWPSVSDKQALQSLRAALYRLRQTLDRAGAELDPPISVSEQLLTITRQTVIFNTVSAPLQLLCDVEHFRSYLTTTQSHSHTALPDCDECMAALEAAASLYHGELLSGFGLADAPDFEEWLLLQREMLHQQALLAFRHLATAHEERGVYDKAADYAARALSFDPYREASQRLVMRLLALRGLPDQALAQYASCRQLMMEEFGAEPEAETVALAEQIRRGELKDDKMTRWQDDKMADSSGHPVVPSSGHLVTSQHDWHEMPTGAPFFGRADEVVQLETWLVDERCRLVSILAIGGMGKTSLVAHVVPTVAEHFDLVIWRSLLNAPPLGELIKTILPILSQQQMGVLPDDLPAQLRHLLGYLQEQRVLLILDNLESILQADAAGHYRPDYEGYEQLLHGMVTGRHQGQLLLTSREQPSALRRLANDTPMVRSLSLGGLDISAGEELLLSRGLQETTGDEAALIERYSGNPLALKLVADTVQDLFFGDLQEFMAEDSFIFDDVRHVLDQQFVRLTTLEQEILFWLAIKRIPTDVPALREIMRAPPVGRTLLEALSSLQRRSLIERQVGGFTLQNVISEYLTDRFIERATQELTQGALDLLHRHSLMLVQSEEHVRQSQIRLILQPIARQIRTNLTRDGFAVQLQQVLDKMRLEVEAQASYAAGTILNLLIHLKHPLDEIDFSHLSIRQVDLRNHTVTDVNFMHADFANCTFTQTFSRIEAVAISPDGTILAGSGDGGEIRLYHLPDGQLIETLAAHTHSVTALAFSPDGTTLASASEDGTTRLWTPQTGRVIHVLESQIMPRSVAFSPDGLWIACVGISPLVYVWDAQCGALLWTLDIQTWRAEDVTFDPTGRLMAIGDIEGRIHLWQVGEAEPRPSKTLHTTANCSVFSLLFNQAGTHLLSGTENGNVDIWDVARGEQIDALTGHTDEVLTLAYSADETVLFSGSRDYTIRIWQMGSRQTVSVLTGHTTYVWSLALTPDGQLLATGGEDGSIRFWNVAIPEQSTPQETIYGYRCSIYNVCWSADGRWVATRDVHGEVCRWDMENAFPQLSGLGGERVVPTWMSIAFSSDSKLLAVTSESGLQLWDVENQTLLGTLDVITTPHNVAFSTDGSLLATGHDEGIVRLWDIVDFMFDLASELGDVKLFRQLQANSGVTGVAFAPKSDLLITWDTYYTQSTALVCLWSPTTGQDVKRVRSDKGKNFAIVDSAGRYLAADSDFNILLFNLSDRAQVHPLRKLKGHTHHVSSAAFSPDGLLLVSGSLDHSIRLWDVANGEQISVLGHHPQYVTGVVFSPDGEFVASIGKEGTLRVWHLASGECCHVLHAPGPYEGMNITGITGISEAQKVALKALGAVEK